MSPDDFKVTLDIAQIVLVGGLIWGLARMSQSVDVLTKTTSEVVEGLKGVGTALAELAGRVLVLEDRSRRK